MISIRACISSTVGLLPRSRLSFRPTCFLFVLKYKSLVDHEISEVVEDRQSLIDMRSFLV